MAAVCYRHQEGSVEFLLVRTGSGRWTFPKGNVEPHLGPRDSAALEALEEAGVLGRISTDHFTSYVHAKGDDRRDLVFAYLVNVWDRVEPEEEHREPTWFKPRAAKRVLRIGRSSKYHQEIERVIDEAISILLPSRMEELSRLHLTHARASL